MKTPKLILAAIALCLSLASFSQTDSTKRDSTPLKDTAAGAHQALTEPVLQQSQTTSGKQPQAANATQLQGATPHAVNSNGHEAAQKPNFGRYYIPVLGSYQSSETTAETKSVTITGDESNAGKVWIEGLGSSKFYAILKTLPGTYKVPAQQVESVNIEEGTVIYNDATRQINICLGFGFKEANPSDALSSGASEPVSTEKVAKGKHKAAPVKVKTILSFSGIKADHTTASSN